MKWSILVYVYDGTETGKTSAMTTVHGFASKRLAEAAAAAIGKAFKPGFGRSMSAVCMQMDGEPE